MSEQMKFYGGLPAISIASGAPLEHRDLKRRSVHGAAATVVSQGVRFVVQFAVQVLLARLLVPSEFGIVAMVMPLVGFVQMFTDLGLLQVTVQKPEITQNELSALFWVSVAASTVLALLVVLLSPLAAWFYHEPRATAVTAAVGSLLILGGLAAQPMAVMNRQMRFMPIAIIDIAAAVAAGAGGIAAAAEGCGYWSLVIMQAASAVSMLVLAWAFSGWRPSRPRRVPALGALLRFGGSVTGANVVNYFSYTMDNVLIGARWGDVQLGFYDRGFRLMLLPVVQIVTPFSRVAVPLLSRLQHDPERYRVAYTRIMRAVLLVTTPAIVFAIVNARPLLLSALGSRWSPAVPIFAWLGLSALLAPIKLSLGWLFISQNRAHEQFRCTCIGTVIMVGAFLAGLRWGAAGVAAATAIASWVLYSPLLCWMATRSGPVRLRNLCDVVYPFLIAGATAWAVLSALRGALPAVWPVGLPCALAIAYVVQVVVFACLPQGWHALLEVWELRAMFARSTSRTAADA